MYRRFISFALSAMLILTLIPQITFAVEDAVDMADEENIITEEQSEEAVSEESTEEAADEILVDISEETDTVDVAESGIITGFAPLETSEYYYEGDPEEGDLTVNLPETLSVYLDGSDQPSEIAVTWESLEDFDDSDFYFYSMRPVWNDGITLSDSLSESVDVPWVTVYKQEPANEDIEPVLTEDELEPLYTGEDVVTDPEETADDTADNLLRSFALGTTDGLTGTIAEESYADTASNTAAIYNYLTGTMGLNKAAACGVMININAESAMSPTNLQNSYNSSLQLSDAEYTKRVDAGKGAYKTGSGASKNFKSDSAGYGLCQWTSSGRKSNLLSRAVSTGTSIGNISMQLAHLNNELQSYQQVLTTLKKVPNNAAGAYIAAAEFCLAFEIPANTVSTAESRGKSCLSNYWKTYSGSAASVSGTSFLSLCGYAYPITVKKGKGMDVTGYAVSNYDITSLTGTITNSSGKAVYSKTVRPGNTAYKISALDSAMKFASLGVGTYTYTLKATDSLGKSVTASHRFNVVSSGSTAKELGFATTGASVSSGTAETTTAAVTAAKVKKGYTGTFPKLPKRGKFKKGDKGKQVKNVQRFLNWYGHYGLKVDGKYGKKTVKAVKKYQKSMGLGQTGKFGKNSLAKAKAYKR